MVGEVALLQPENSESLGPHLAFANPGDLCVCCLPLVEWLFSKNFLSY